MIFLIERLIKNLERDYNIDLKLIRKDGIYSLYLMNIPDVLRHQLILLTYDKVIGYSKRYTKDKKSIIETIPIINKENIVNPITNSENNTKSVYITFNYDNYGEKINKIDHCIRRYYENHSQIDEINGIVY